MGMAEQNEAEMMWERQFRQIIKNSTNQRIQPKNEVRLTKPYIPANNITTQPNRIS
jgi:hypothetical protein